MRLSKKNWDAQRPGISGGDNRFARFLSCSNQLLEKVRVHEGLIAGENDYRRRGPERFDAGADGAAEASLPRIVRHNLGR